MTAKKTGMRSPLFSKHGANALSQKQNKEREHHSGHYKFRFNAPELFDYIKVYVDREKK